ncbi:MAG: hypothetical protein ACLFO5_05850 [Opitutales bacterium]
MTKKVSVKKTASKKTPVKKSAAKKKTAKKAASSTGSVKKKATKKTTTGSTRSAPSPQATKTTVIARVDAGFGNGLYVRGDGAELNWDQGILMRNISPYEWRFETTQANTGMIFKFLINDDVWAEGENLSVAAGGTSVSSPTFHWD